MISPRILLVQIRDLTNNRPRQNIQQIGCERLVEIPSWSCRKEDRSELRGDGVENVAPIDGSPHPRRYFCDGGGIGEPEGVRIGANGGEEDAEGDLYS